jgi:hypothetical protein
MGWHDNDMILIELRHDMVVPIFRHARLARRERILTSADIFYVLQVWRA